MTVTAIRSHPDLDQSLVQRLLEGDRSALADIYQRHADAVFGLSLRLTRNRTLAEEATQEVFVRLWKRPHAYDAARGSLRSFLIQHTRGRSIDLIRSESARRAREDREGWLAPRVDPGTDDQAIDMTVGETVRRALAALPGDQRRPIELAYYGGHSYREVATLLGEAEGTVKSRIRSGLRRLHDELRGAVA
ncbi:ECF RNA polymerase sigma factor SigK [soil metagenome]